MGMSPRHPDGPTGPHTDHWSAYRSLQVPLTVAAAAVAVLLAIILPTLDTRALCAAALLVAVCLGGQRISAQSRRIRYRLLVNALDGLDVGLEIVDADGQPVLTNRLARETHAAAFCTAGNGSRRLAITALAEGPVPGRESEIRTAQDVLRVQVRANPLTSGSGQVIGAVAMSTDITAASALQIEVHAIAEARRSVLAESDVRATVCRAAREVTQAMATMLFEVEGDDLVATAQEGVQIAELRVARDGESVAARTFRSAQPRIVSNLHAEPRYSVGFATMLERLLDRSIGAVAYMPMLAENQCRGVLVAVLEASRPAPTTPTIEVLELLAGEAVVALTREDLQRQLVELTRTDPLTGLPNRRALSDHLAHMPRQGGVAILDLDHFKAYNDSHGHPAGDQLLARFADVLRRTVRSEDIPARLGGEEFAIVVHDGDDLHGLMDRLRTAWVAEQQAVTFSAGVARHWADRPVADTLQLADDACYAAKRAGRDRTCSAYEDTTSGEDRAVSN